MAPYRLFARELPQELKVVFEEMTDVVDLVAQHGEALDTHSKSVSRIAVAIDSAVFQYLGVHHATAQDFDPSGMLTNRTAFLSAQKAAHIHFRAGFGEGEIGRPEADFGIVAEKVFRKQIQG